MLGFQGSHIWQIMFGFDSVMLVYLQVILAANHINICLLNQVTFNYMNTDCRQNFLEVNSSRGNKYYGECSSYSTDCLKPANREAASDTETDRERWAPPLQVQITVLLQLPVGCGIMDSDRCCTGIFFFGTFSHGFSWPSKLSCGS